MSNKTSYTAQVMNLEDHVNSPPSSAVIISTVVAGAVDTIPDISRNNRTVHVELADRPILTGFRVPISGLAVSCVAKPE
ncbi:MAG: hypothetical protein ABJA80_06655 [bacterium]